MKKNIISIKMKTNKILIFLGVLAVTFGITSCVNDDDYDTPNVTVQSPDLSSLGEKSNFGAVVSRYLDAVADGDPVGVFDENDDDLYIEGYVISSDKGGNFFEELIIQNSVDEGDAGSDPRRGLKVEVNVRNLSDTYEFGRKVYIKLNGLAVSESNGVYTLGKAVGNSLEQIQEYEYKDFIIRDPEVATITPKITTIGDLTEADENTFVQLDGMQIDASQLGLTYSGEASDLFDGFRNLINCSNLGCGGGITLQTSTFADFKSIQLPQGKGSIKGIFTRDFRDDFNVIVINSTSDIDFSDTNRCDPMTFSCNETSGGGSAFFTEDFEGFGGYDSEGWTNVNVCGNDTDWFISSFSGNNYSRISAFRSNNIEATAWLVTPAINMDSTSGEELLFDVQSNFDNGVILSVHVSTDFSGDPSTATWQELDVDIPVGPSGSFGSFETVGPVNISCLTGDIHIGFLYKGSDPGATTRYHVDNVVVTGN